MNDRMKAALIGGLILGVLSAIPFVNILNACCCLWAIIGGIVASYLYIKGSQTPINPGEGAIVGATAGGIGAVVYMILGIPLNLLMGNTMLSLIAKMIEGSNPEQAEALRKQMEAGPTIGSVILNALIYAVLLVIFSTVGGLLGVPIFEKRKGGPGDAPPPPQDFGGGQPGAGFSAGPPPGNYGSGPGYGS